ncbi:MAG TPA: hypothetical protein VGO96_07600 [Pyrinomonadaceae bacterium]|jgi:hypothetical protein|nr:hypothetical protein [Pyrinomonadaceae bacterium]
MRFKANQYLGLCLILFLSGLPVSAQSDAGVTARLFIRYEHGAAQHRIAEDLLTLKLSVNSEARAKVAIRVCSKEPMAFALATAGANPFLIADRLVNAYAYSPERVVFLRSEDCLSTDNASEPVTEIWAIPEGGSLPPQVEALGSNQVRLTPLGKEQVNRGTRDYEAALQKLIRRLRANPSSAGVVFGYFLERPSPALQRRLREVARTLERSGLARGRYLVRPKAWDDEVSTYPPDTEPEYPSLFVVEVARSCAVR